MNKKLLGLSVLLLGLSGMRLGAAPELYKFKVADPTHAKDFSIRLICEDAAKAKGAWYNTKENALRQAGTTGGFKVFYAGEKRFSFKKNKKKCRVFYLIKD